MPAPEAAEAAVTGKRERQRPSSGKKCGGGRFNGGGWPF